MQARAATRASKGGGPPRSERPIPPLGDHLDGHVEQSDERLRGRGAYVGLRIDRAGVRVVASQDMGSSLPPPSFRSKPTQRPHGRTDSSSERATLVPRYDPEAFARDAEMVRLVVPEQASGQECLAAVGSASAVLVRAITAEELKSFTLDRVSAFLFAQIDGATDVDTILDIAGVPRLLALRYLRGLVTRGIVATASSRWPQK